jgi:hypothetical protein
MIGFQAYYSHTHTYGSNLLNIFLKKLSIEETNLSGVNLQTRSIHFYFFLRIRALLLY